MKNKGLRSKQFKMSLYASFVILATFPLALNSILNQESFDTSSDASYEEPAISCTISFPYVSPLSLPENGTVHLMLEAKENGGDTAADYEDIVKIDVNSTLGSSLFTKEYDSQSNENGNSSEIIESFLYTADDKGMDVINGVVTAKKLNGEFTTTDCVVISPLAGNRITVLQANTAPIFTTSPDSATPSNVLKAGDSYSYTLKATDAEGDTISFDTSFTPGSTWLNVSVIKNGTNGELELKFQGIAGAPAAYLGNVFIHDGYTTHLNSQSWVISVEQGENDTPQIDIVAPKNKVEITQGDKIQITWKATDLNQIVTYNIFYTSNAGDETTWIKLESLTNKFNSYIWETDAINPGSYKIIVQATDNQNPAATGTAISPNIKINARTEIPNDPTDPNNSTNPNDKPIDGPVIETPQVIELSPNDGASLVNPKPTISATLTTGSGATIKKDTIIFELDDEDYTADIDIAMIAKNEYRFVYKPQDNLEFGKHKVTVKFEDNQDRKGSETWSFEINGENKDTISIFGFKIPKQTATIFGIGLLVLLAALTVPWILYAAWKNSNDEDDEYTVYDMPPNNNEPHTTPNYQPTVDPTVSTVENNTYNTTSTQTEEPVETTYFDTGVGYNPNAYTTTDPVEMSQSNNVLVKDSQPINDVNLPQQSTVEDPNTVYTPHITDDTNMIQQPMTQQATQPKTIEPIFTDTKIEQPVTPIVEPINTPTNTISDVENEPNVEEIQKLATALKDYKDSDPYAFLDESNTANNHIVQPNTDPNTQNTNIGEANA